MDKKAFLAAYRQYIYETYEWAMATDALDAFMVRVSDTLNGRTSWNWKVPGAKAAWEKIGGKGQPSLKDLRALPEGPEGGDK